MPSVFTVIARANRFCRCEGREGREGSGSEMESNLSTVAHENFFHN